jgi:hypothetical protein
MLKLFSIYTGKVSKDTGIVSGVSVITSGVEAIGHGIYTDPTTLSQVKGCADSMRGGVQVKMNHGSGFDAIVGVLKNFRIELATEKSMGDKIGQCDCLRADLHLLKSHPLFDQICEMCDAMPESFGLSISFSGNADTIDEMDFARCTELYSVDLVEAPAANPNGLFNSKVDSKRFSEDMITELEALWKKIGAGLAALNGKPDSTELTAVKTDLTALGEKISGELTQLSSDLATAKLSVASLTKERDTLLSAKTDFEAKITNLSTENTAINTELSQACLNGKLIELKGADGKPLAAEVTDADRLTAMLAVPLVEKQKAVLQSVHKAFADLGLKNTLIPASAASAGGGTANLEVKTMTLTQFRALTPAAKSEFSKAVNAGKAKLTE